MICPRNESHGRIVRIVVRDAAIVRRDDHAGVFVRHEFHRRAITGDWYVSCQVCHQMIG